MDNMVLRLEGVDRNCCSPSAATRQASRNDAERTQILKVYVYFYHQRRHTKAPKSGWKKQQQGKTQNESPHFRFSWWVTLQIMLGGQSKRNDRSLGSRHCWVQAVRDAAWFLDSITHYSKLFLCYTRFLPRSMHKREEVRYLCSFQTAKN